MPFFCIEPGAGLSKTCWDARTEDAGTALLAVGAVTASVHAN